MAGDGCTIDVVLIITAIEISLNSGSFLHFGR